MAKEFEKKLCQRRAQILASFRILHCLKYLKVLFIKEEYGHWKQEAKYLVQFPLGSEHVNANANM